MQLSGVVIFCVGVAWFSVALAVALFGALLTVFGLALEKGN